MSNEEKLLDYLKRATVDLREARRRVGELEYREREPIAIVGMACRYPGGVNSPEGLWRLVLDGTDAVTPFPADRGWDLDGLYDPEPGKAGKSIAREGGFLYDAADFDAEFFGISPREAAATDAQQRLLLEASWEAIERGGIDPLSLKGSRTGVFAGVMYHDYGQGGSAGSLVSGRVSYTLGLEGPAVTVDTACSSSLVALHWAMQALRRGECSLALAGGVTVMATPDMFTYFNEQRGLAADGRCKSFSASADGTGCSEGVGVLLIERLSDAQRLGHPVLAVVRGSAVNQDGASNGLTAPNGPSQQRVIHQALADADLSPSDVDAVEAHGTGTKLGDPIEAQALLNTYGKGRPVEHAPLYLGSIKSNIGHAQAAAGVGGVIKMVQAMRHGFLPKSLYADAPSPQVDWTAGAVELLTDTRTWPETDRPRRAGVSSFGISGTNAHVILEQAPAEEPSAPDGDGDGGWDGGLVRSLPVVPWVLSGKTPDALHAQAHRLLTHLTDTPQPVLDTGYSLATTRAALHHRAVLLTTDPDDARTRLAALAAGDEPAGVVQGSVSNGKLAFLFTGQGSQRPGMGRELHETFPTYRDALDEAISHLDTHLDLSLRDVLFAPEDSPEAALLDRTEYTQPALFALEVALFRLLESWGIRPDYVAGHSIGELAAAHVAGALSLEDAATLVAARGRLMQALPATGAMIAIQATEDEIRPHLTDHVTIAALNSPTSTVISGDTAEAQTIANHFADRKTKHLRTSHAFHSPLMNPMLEEFGRTADTLTHHTPHIPLISNTTAEPHTPDPHYWTTHARDTVRFTDTLSTLHTHGVTTYLEIGPDAVLTAMAQDTLTDHHLTFTPTLRPHHNETHTTLTALSHLHTHGATVDWEAVFAHTDARTTDLPTYAFQHQHYWTEATPGDGNVSLAGLESVGHPLLGAVLVSPDNNGIVLTGRLSLPAQTWIADHDVLGTVLLPGTAFLELALQAGDHIGCVAVEELILEAPLALPDHGALALQVVVAGADTAGLRPVSIYSRPAEDQALDTKWTRHATGLLSPHHTEPTFDFTQWPPKNAQPLPVEDGYERLADRGYTYGPTFQGLKAAWRHGDEIYAEITLPEEAHADAERFGIHPALLDATMHVNLVASQDGQSEGEDPDSGQTVLPFSWNGVALHAIGASSLRLRITPTGPDSAALAMADATGQPVLSVGSLVSRPVSQKQLQGGKTEFRDSLFRVEWQQTPLPSGATDSGAAPPLPSLDEILDATSGDSIPPYVRLGIETGPGTDVVTGLRTTLDDVLAAVQTWLADERFESSRLVVTTLGAMAPSAEERTDPVASAVWGLVRSARSEHPDRFVLVDLDDSDASLRALPGAVMAGEAELALRDGQLHTPRLARIAAETDPAESLDGARLDPEGTVLITGGTSGLGALVARHLVEQHGVRHLLLISRRGPDAPRAGELHTELEKSGADVTIAACDVSDRDALAQLIKSVPATRPLTGVVHSAGLLDDGLVGTLTPHRMDTVLRSKADAAWHLHELTAGLDPALFVVFSSVASVFGGGGQGNYAAANAFLDGLVQHRRASGLSGLSLAWGPWAEVGGMADQLGEADRERLTRSGMPPLRAEDGLPLFDAAMSLPDSLLLPVRLDVASLLGAGADVPVLLRGLVRVPGRQTARNNRARGEAGLAQRLVGLSADEQSRMLTDLVRTHVAAVLGHAGADTIEPTRAFSDIGFDSLASIELRNRLNSATGLRLPATLTFDYPTAQALAQYIATLVLEDRAELATAAKPATSVVDDEPIAIVGMACRYPGGVNSPEDLWRMVVTGTDAVTGFPVDRGWDLDNLYDPEPGTPGKTYSREGGFLHDAADFDPAFFGVSPREATEMDPQQRLLLETSWEAVERAGIDPHSLKGSPTGVFAGVMYHDYALNGTAGSIVSGRVSYTLGLEGPAVTVDTACSSSLVALHWAMQALRRGECSLALAGGVTVMATPETFVDFSRQRGLSPDGRCKSFAAGADGTGWGEGVGMLLVERLSDAQRLGHPVLAVVRGSAVNQDGASNGLTAPNGPSQQRVIHQALADAHLSPSDVDAVEAHGTGTKLGDPIEAQALLATYGQQRTDDQPLWLGSIKSNIGHTQAAAGVAGIIKMVQAIHHGVLPQTLHIDEPSPHIDWTTGAVELLTDTRTWPETDRPRRAGVSSFGISGTNAHIILESAPQDATKDKKESADTPTPGSEFVPWVLSGKDESALSAQAAKLATLLETDDTASPADIGLSLATTRTAFEHRAVLVHRSRTDHVESLRTLAAGEKTAGVVQGSVTNGKLAFLFTGQGSQRPGMGRELYETFPTYRDALDEAISHLDPHLDLSLRDVLFAPEDSPEAALLDRTEYTQPALFALEVALFRLLESWGIRPDYVAGHSIGELAAAHVAGALTLQDAATLVAARGRLMQALPTTGTMIAIQATEDEIRPHLTDHVTIAALNTPTSTVISGDTTQAQTIANHFPDRKTKHLRTSHAFHSPLMNPMLEEFGRTADTLTHHTPHIPLISNTTAEPHTPDPHYWTTHARDTVRFTHTLTTLHTHGVTTYLEIGPDAVLTAMAQDTLTDHHLTFTPTLRPHHNETHTTLTALSHLHTHGTTINWQAVFAHTHAHTTPLPTYAFQHQHYWTSTPTTSIDATHLGQATTEHPLLSAVVELAGGGGLALTGRVSSSTHAWLADHDVLGIRVVPAAGFVDMMLRAAHETDSHVIDGLSLTAPLVLPEVGDVTLQVVVGAPDEDRRRAVDCYSRDEAAPANTAWVHHAAGVLVPAQAGKEVELVEWPPPSALPLKIEGGYERLLERGYAYGPIFQGLKAAWRHGDEIYAEITLPEEAHADAERFGIHPALLDATMHVDRLDGPDSETPLLAAAWNGVALHTPGATELRVRIATTGPDSVSLAVADGSGRPVLSVESLVSRPVSVAELRAADSVHQDSLFTLDWQPVALPATGAPDASALVSLDEVSRTDAEIPAYVLLEVAPVSSDDVAADVRTVLASVVDAIRSCVADRRYDGSRLVVATRNGVAVGPSDVELGPAPVWGLVRAAQAEHPDRFVLVDLDHTEASAQALHTALTLGEPELVLREGRLLVPRLARAKPLPAAEPVTGRWDPAGTVLVTGGTRGAGALVARHLVAEHGVRRILLTEDATGNSASGAATGASSGSHPRRDADVVRELRKLGAEARVVAGEFTDREAVALLLTSVPADHPLCAVVHVGAPSGNALLDGVTPEHLDEVLRNGSDGAWALHEATRELPLDAFVLVSSSVGVLHGMGQGGRAAAATFLDALAVHRTAQGLPTVSLAFGPWRTESGEASDGRSPDGRDRSGLPVLDAEEGLRLFDAALGLAQPSVFPVRLDVAALRAEPHEVPPVLSGLVRRPAHRRSGAAGGVSGAGIRRLLADLAESEREQRLLDIVVAEVAAVLEHDSATAVEPDQPFQAMGFDSLAAIELRRRLERLTGLQLTSTLVFDHPTARDVTAYLGSVMQPEEADAAAPVLAEADRLEAALLTLGSGGGDTVSRVTARLDALMRRWSDLHSTSGAEAAADPATFEAATDDELFRVLDSELGSS
ncbi:SDR family NAD(P)-dependent oxidoreductase [Streptomyces sp. NBC_01754]|uniref:type I polyketide synthase n=1 Tax=Streptomyces sp. NBC_01754 TaxID=2975930 RepID=UPI002DDB2CA4|nr:SDR family NAD(P)-dependent oxidoreductase [Streptomyces sp. NBC_01754]WSC94335.1 SDR family NAD(P)-dependent oxidoreductase [Streptomyces sp. NBC_01754]